MTTHETKPVIFISYAHLDEPQKPRESEVQWLSFVTGFLKPAERKGALEVWTDRLMPGGADWNPEIEHKLRKCDIFMLLISHHSMSSDYVVDKEIAIIRARQANGEDVHFYPLLLTPTPGIGLDIVRDKNLRPRDAKPFSSYSFHDRLQHMADAADEIVKIVAEIAARKSAPVPWSPTASASSAPEPIVASTLPPNPKMIGAILDGDGWRNVVTGKTTRAAYDERAAKPRYYISYAWADASDPNRERDVERLLGEARKRGIEVVRDRAALSHGDLISEFMVRIGESDRVFIFLSDKYLKSPFCMFELFEMWCNSRQNKAEFIRRVRFITIDGTSIQKPREWLAYAGFWKRELDLLRQEITDLGWEYADQEAQKRYDLMKTFASKVSDVLALFADTVQPRTFEDFLAYGFDDLTERTPKF
jgi:internalin A